MLDEFVEFFSEQVVTRSRNFDGQYWNAGKSTSLGTAARLHLQGRRGHAAVRGVGPAAESFALDAALNKARSDCPVRLRPNGLPGGNPLTDAFPEDVTTTFLERLRDNLAESILKARVRLLYHDVAQNIQVERASNDAFLASDSRRRWGISIEIRNDNDQIIERSCGGSCDPTLQMCDQLSKDILAALSLSDLPIGTVCDGDHVVCFSPTAAAMLFHEAAGHLLEQPDFLAAPSFRIGQQFGPAWLTIEDRPDIEALFATQFRDDCGFECSRVPLVRQGTLVGLLSETNRGGFGVPTACARRQDFRYPPQPRMSNLVVAPGSHSSDDLVSHSGASIYVGKASEGFVDRDSNVFGVNVSEAWSLSRGRLTERLNPFALECPVSHFLNCLIDFGSDQQTLSMYCISNGAILPVTSSASTLVCGPLRVSCSPKRPTTLVPERWEGNV